MLMKFLRHANNLLYRLCGLRLTHYHPDEPPAFIDGAFWKIYEKHRDKTSVFWSDAHTAYAVAKYVAVNGVEGDIVECGVWRGGCSIIMAETLKYYGCLNKKVFMYDTYAGMSEPSERDFPIGSTESPHPHWKELNKDTHNAWFYAPIEEVKRNANAADYPSDNFVFVKGKVEDTLPGVIPCAISVLRLDTDWYRSTYHEMEHLFPRLSIGGVLIVDDYAAYAGAKNAVDDYLKEQKIRIFLAADPLTGKVAGIKQH